MRNSIIKTTGAILLIMATFLAMAQTRLPVNAQKYIQTHFPKEKVDHEERDDNKFEVRLSGGYELEFSNSGNMREVEGNGNTIPNSVIPAKISSYLKQKYPNRKVRKIEMESNGYEINLSDDLELKFDRSGNFIKADD